MPIKALKKLLFNLASEGVADITFDNIVKAMPIGKNCDMGEGKTCRGIRLWEDEYGKRNFYLHGFMPKGTYYETNMHPKSKEVLYVCEGVLENTNFKVSKEAGDWFIWRPGTPHSLKALTDVIFYAHLIEQ